MTITDQQRMNGARPAGVCTNCGADLMVWDEAAGDVRDTGHGSAYCYANRDGRYREHTSNVTLLLARQAVYMFGALAGLDAHSGLCTCCEKPRFTFRYGGEREEWGHIDTQDYAEMRHIHVDTGSRDCDSTYSDSHVYRLGGGIAHWALRPVAPGHPVETPTFHHLWQYLIGSLPSTCSGPTTVKVDAGTVEWHTDTDEGYSAGQARVCAEAYCAFDDDTHRDATAEAMNY